MSKELQALEDIILYLNASESEGLYCENIEIIETALKDYEKLTNNNVRFTSKYDVEKLVEDYGKLKDEYDRLESIHTDFIKQYNLLMKDHSKVLKALERMVRNGYVSPNVEELKIIEVALKREDSIEITAIDIEQDNKELCKENKKLKRALEMFKENLVVGYDESENDMPCLVLGFKVGKDKMAIIYHTFDKEKIDLLKEVINY